MNTKKIASLGFGRRATPAQKTRVVQELRQRHDLKLLLSIAQIPRATFYYHLKRTNRNDKYGDAKAEITAIYHENKGRYGYRRITMELHNRGIRLNHKTVQRLMKENDAYYTIPPRKSTRIPWFCDWHIYKYRHVIECFFQKLKWFRRIATRFDKLDSVFLACIYLASCSFLLL